MRAYADRPVLYRVRIEKIYPNGEGRYEYVGPYVTRGQAKQQATRIRNWYGNYTMHYQLFTRIESATPEWEVDADPAE